MSAPAHPGTVVAICAAALFAVWLPASGAGQERCVTYVAENDLRDVIAAACRTPLPKPQSSRRAAWQERGGSISESLDWMPDEADGLAPQPLVRAAEVRVIPPPADGERFHVASLRAPPAGSRLGTFIRPVSGSGTAVIPAGPFVVIAFDRRDRVVSLSRPAIAAAARTTSAAAPSRMDALAVRLRLPRPGRAGDEAGLTLASGEVTRAPDVTIARPHELLAIWYDPPPGPARLALASETLWLPADELTLGRRGLQFHDEVLRVRPSLTVAVGAIAAPADLALPDSVTVSLAAPGGAPFAQKTLRPGGSARWEHLPPEILAVTLRAGAATFAMHADLSGGDDQELQFPLEPIVLTGTVYSRGAGAPAVLRFSHAEEPLRVETDERGRYQAVLWRPGRYMVEVTPAGSEAGPLKELIRVEGSREHDFHVPSSRVTVVVRDAADGKPVGGATVTPKSTWIDPSTGRSSSHAVSQQTDETGTVTLPPLRPGKADIYVFAPGYASAAPVSIAVDDATEQRVTIELSPVGEAAEVQVLLPGGAAAAGAEALAVRELTAQDALWRGSASASGVVRVPRRLGAVLLVLRHPRAGSRVIALGQGEPAPATLPPPAPPFVLRVVDGDGNGVAAPIALEIDGSLLAGVSLSFFAWSTAGSAGDGLWIARNLPPAPLRVAATRAGLHAPLDTFARQFTFPWPRDARVRVVTR